MIKQNLHSPIFTFFKKREKQTSHWRKTGLFQTVIFYFKLIFDKASFVAKFFMILVGFSEQIQKI